MVVIVANNLPDKVRGVLKCWFIEPMPNIFVSSISKRVEDRVLDFLKPYMSESSGLIVLRSNDKNLQGYTMHMHRSPKRGMKMISGNHLINLKP